MKVAILDDFQQVALASADWSAVQAAAEITVFSDHLSEVDAVAKRLAPFEIVVVMRERTPFPRPLFERLPNLKLLVTSGMRNLSIDLAAATKHGVTVCGTDNVGFTTAELAWGLILAVARKIPQEDRALREGRWQTSLGTGLHGRTLGVLGLGKVGARVAAIGQAFGMEVIAWSQNLTEKRCGELGVRHAGSKERLLQAADFVTIHLVLSERTRGLIGARELGQMKPSAYIVNTSRGPIIDQRALIEALKTNAIAGAGLDVFDVEPMPPDHSLRQAPHTVLTPHLGYVTDANYRIFYGQCAEDVVAFLKGTPLRALNPIEGPQA